MGKDDFWSKIQPSKLKLETSIQASEFSQSKGKPTVVGKGFEERKVFFTKKDRENHTHVIGSTGTGKSKFLELMLRQDILDRSCGLCLIDPHGSLYDEVVLYASHKFPHLADRFVLFAPAKETDQVIGFNPIPDDREYLDYALDMLISACLKAWGQDRADTTPRITKWLENIFYPLIVNELTLVEAAPFFDIGSKDARNKREALLSFVNSDVVLGDWMMFESSTLTQKQTLIEGAANRLRKFLRSEIIRNVIGQKQRALNFADIMAQGKIVLVNLNSYGKVSYDASQLLGIMLVNEIFRCAKLRDPRDQKIKPFYLYIDEFGQFITRDIARALEEARKYRLHLILAHQHLAQLKKEDEYLYASVMTNCKNKVVFGGLSKEDAEIMTEEVATGFLHLKAIKDEMYTTKVRHIEETRIVRGVSKGTSRGSSESETSTQSQSSTDTKGEGRSVSHGRTDTEGQSHSTGRNESTGTSQSKGTSRGTSDGYSDTEGESQSLSEGENKGYSKGRSDSASTGHSTGSSESESRGTSTSRSRSDTRGESHGTSESESTGTSKNRGYSDTKGESWGTSESNTQGRSTSKGHSYNRGTSDGYSNTESDSQSDNHNSSRSHSRNESSTDSESTTSSQSHTTGRNQSQSRSHSNTYSEGEQQSRTFGKNRSEQHSHTEGESEGESQSKTTGQNWSDSQSRSKGTSESENWGTSTSRTHGQNRSHSKTHSDNSSENESTGTSQTRGTSESDTENRSRAISQQESQSESHSRAESAGTSYGQTRGTSESQSKGESETIVPFLRPEEYTELVSRTFWTKDELYYMEMAAIKNQGVAQAYIKIANQPPIKTTIDRVQETFYSPILSPKRIDAFRTKVFEKNERYYTPLAEVKQEYQQRQIEVFGEPLRFDEKPLVRGQVIDVKIEGAEDDGSPFDE